MFPAAVKHLLHNDGFWHCFVQFLLLKRCRFMWKILSKKSEKEGSPQNPKRCPTPLTGATSLTSLYEGILGWTKFFVQWETKDSQINSQLKLFKVTNLQPRGRSYLCTLPHTTAHLTLLIIDTLHFYHQSIQFLHFLISFKCSISVYFFPPEMTQVLELLIIMPTEFILYIILFPMIIYLYCKIYS